MCCGHAGQNGTKDEATSSGDDRRYNGFTFTAEAVSIIESANATAKPMFMYFALHNTHSPIEAPLRIQALYKDFSWCVALKSLPSVQTGYANMHPQDKAEGVQRDGDDSR
jgi:hypothetical protein